MTTKQDKPGEPKEPDVVPLDDPTVPYSLVPVGEGSDRERAAAAQPQPAFEICTIGGCGCVRPCITHEGIPLEQVYLPEAAAKVLRERYNDLVEGEPVGAVPASPWQPIATDWAQCSHTFVEVNGDTPDGFTAVRCSQCQCPGERNNTTGDVFWPAT